MTRVVTPEPADAMETIRHLRAELQSVLEREAATHARHDARVEALEAQIADFEATVQPAPVAVQTVLSNPLKDRGKMVKPVPGAPAGGYPLTPNPVDDSQGRETDSKPSVDLTPEAVARLACEAELFGYNRQAATLRALSERLAEREASETATIQWLQELKPKVQRIEAERDAAEAALATLMDAHDRVAFERDALSARLAEVEADALRKAVDTCLGKSPMSEDTIKGLTAAQHMNNLVTVTRSRAFHDAAYSILALIPKAAP